ncbi:MAG: hypothetical protein KDH88_13800 [Chromatiales bacterium]|nr:hypothetical protein [Chromatiales bacterium]
MMAGRAGVLVFCLLANLAQAQTDPAELRGLNRAGAGQLALRLLDRDQPDYFSDPAAWMVWERERLGLLEVSGRWHELIERADHLPKGLPVDFLRWVDSRKALALLESAQGHKARELLRDLIWDVRQRPSAEELSLWRQMIIRSYLIDGLDADAANAMLRYRQDHGPGDERFRALRARLLLRQGRAEEAVRSLRGAKASQARVLALWAGFQAGVLDASNARNQAKSLVSALGDRPDLQSAALQLQAQAESRLGLTRERLHSLESALVLGGGADPLYPLAAEDLWSAYRQEGERLANAMRLLRGKDEVWFRSASERIEGASQEARAMLAVVAGSAVSQRSRRRAHDAIAASIPSTDDELLLALYAGLEPKGLSDALRRRIADALLANGKVGQASNWLVDIDAASAGPDAWQDELLRARVLLLGGHKEAGLAALRGLTERGEVWDAGQVDRFLQVLFDLQALGLHDPALAFLRGLGQRKLDTQTRRELFFWMAESHGALGQQEQAALWYLRSASWPDPAALDPWAQTARFHAAAALGRAGLLEDATEQYRRLLRVARSEERKQALRRELEQLRLRALREERSEEAP